MLRREGDGCPVTGALQLLGDKWTLMIVRDLSRGSRRTTDLQTRLHPISSRTLVARLKDMMRDRLISRHEYSASPPHVEYALTDRGRLLLPLIDALRELGLALDCNDCEDRRTRLGDYCDACPRLHNADQSYESESARQRGQQRERDDSIVLL
jgi:DNA-binding HxlR family transcriptional regulator